MKKLLLSVLGILLLLMIGAAYLMYEMHRQRILFESGAGTEKYVRITLTKAGDLCVYCPSEHGGWSLNRRDYYGCETVKSVDDDSREIVVHFSDGSSLRFNRPILKRPNDTTHETPALEHRSSQL